MQARATSLKTSTFCVIPASPFFLLVVERIYTDRDRDMSSSPRADGKQPHSKLEEALEIKSLRRIISAYLKLDDTFHSLNNLLSHMLLISFIDVLFSMHLGVSLISPVDELHLLWLLWFSYILVKWVGLIFRIIRLGLFHKHPHTYIFQLKWFDFYICLSSSLFSVYFTCFFQFFL